MFLIVFAFVPAFLLHELAHYLTAKYFGTRLTFRFEWGKLFGKIPIPRYVWDMPEELTLKQKKLVALSGFGVELLAAIPCSCVGLWEYPIVAVLHLVLYSFYAGENNDLRWLSAGE